jgi:GDPmannose 4,6-dehydratase
LGNLDIYRDWGWAPDYVDAMWRILQQDAPDDFVIATGQMHSLHDFVNKTFLALGLNSSDYVDSDSSLLRPADIALSVGCPEKAYKLLGWKSEVAFCKIIEKLLSAEKIAPVII